ncbi:MAG: hypothetical protein R3293_27340 [Candidatus Promineifilaceae bacterium]|nr:hypothetical protein [Candidatus Promineifilaceae bacterium]
MNRYILWHYLTSIGRSFLRFAGYGAGIAAGAGLMIIMIVTRIGDDSPVNNIRFIEVVTNYAIAGALIGGVVGLIYGLLRTRE